MLKVEDISHVTFRAPDLDRMAGYLADFGLVAERHGDRLYARGLGPAPYVHITELGEPGFAALGLRAGSVADVEALAASEGADIRALDRPGGGMAATLTDPDGFTVEVVAGQSQLDPLPLPDREAWNSARDHARLRKAKRIGEGAHVVRLGHAVLSV
jgi:hypothetical protein